MGFVQARTGMARGGRPQDRGEWPGPRGVREAAQGHRARQLKDTEAGMASLTSSAGVSATSTPGDVSGTGARE